MVNTGIFSQTDISGTTRVDSATMSFTLAAYAHLPQELIGCTWRIVLPESALEDWQILNAGEERALHNTLLTQSWAIECLAWIQSGKADVRCTTIRMESMVFYNEDLISGGLMGACSFNAKGFGLLPNDGGFTGCVPMIPMQCHAINGLFDQAWNSATASSVVGEKLDFLSRTHPAAWVYYKSCYKLLDNAKLPKDYIQGETCSHTRGMASRVFWRCWSVSAAVSWRIVSA